MIKLICFGVRPVEEKFFHNLNKHQFQLTFVQDLLTKDNLDLVKGFPAVLLRGGCHTNREFLETMKGYGVKYLLTRTVGFNHIDIEAAKELGMVVARVPAYSPNAISELALTLGMMLFRNVAHATSNGSNKDFRIETSMFSPEIRNSTIGIIGTGKIGLTTAKLFKGMGAKVVGYDLYPCEKGKEILEYQSLDNLLKNSDLVSIHCPFIKGSNYHMIDDEFISKMKDNSILINTARGELQNLKSIIKGIEDGKLRGYGTDVLEGEEVIFKKNLKGETIPNEDIEKLISLYPKVLITPHLGSFTDEALRNTIDISYDNLYKFLTNTRCENSL